MATPIPATGNPLVPTRIVECAHSEGKRRSHGSRHRNQAYSGLFNGALPQEALWTPAAKPMAFRNFGPWSLLHQSCPGAHRRCPSLRQPNPLRQGWVAEAAGPKPTGTSSERPLRAWVG